MPVEIERKFLVLRELWQPTDGGTPFRQGYLSRERGLTVRVRRAGERGYITIKGPPSGLARPEFEYEIPSKDADELLGMCPGPLIDKRRHLLEHQGHTWEVDEFLGDNAGLLVAEIELDRADETFARPAWAGEEVTHDPRYLNANLVEHPFCKWR
jgi:CYTH domain-containing protein